MGTQTPIFSFELPTVGGDINIWGTLLNNNFEALEDLLSGVAQITPDLGTGWKVGGIAVTASGTELNVLDGLLSSTANLNVLQTITGLASDVEAAAGTSNVKLMTPLRVAEAISALTPAFPAGAVMYFARNTPPSGWLECNGAAVSRTTYASLFTAIGTTFGAGDGSTTFNLPDLRGEFIRGWDNGRGIDTARSFGSAQSSQNLAHTHTASTGSAGAHSHTLSRSTTTIGTTNIALSGNTANGTISTNSTGDHTHTVTVDSSGGTEARPRNIALMACIKF